MTAVSILVISRDDETVTGTVDGASVTESGVWVGAAVGAAAGSSSVAVGSIFGGREGGGGPSK